MKLLSTFSRSRIVVLIHVVFIPTIILLFKNYEIITYFYPMPGVVCLLFWIVIYHTIKLEDNSIHYIVGLLYSSIAITIASLSFDETNNIIKVSTFESYFWNKMLLNLLGWVCLPLATTELLKLAKPKTDTKRDS